MKNNRMFSFVILLLEKKCDLTILAERIITEIIETERIIKCNTFAA
jgi:hypothetical protein